MQESLRYLSFVIAVGALVLLYVAFRRRRRSAHPVKILRLDDSADSIQLVSWDSSVAAHFKNLSRGNVEAGEILTSEFTK